MRLTNQREAARGADPVLIRSGAPVALREALAIADPSLDLRNPLKGPFLAEPLAWQEDAMAALELARIAGILPAFMVDAEHGGEVQQMEPGDLAAWSDPANLAIATRARLPIAAREDAEPTAGRVTRWEKRLEPWTEEVRSFRVEGFYERFAAKGQIERVARIHRDLARWAGIEVRGKGAAK